MSSQPFKADLRDIHFVLSEQLQIDGALGKAPFADWGSEEVRMVLDEGYRFAREVLAPLNSVGDREGCHVEDGRVITPKGFGEAWKKLYELGFRTLSADTDHGGQGAPYVIQAAIEEFFCGANVAFGMYPGLAQGAADVIAEFGTDAQRALYVPKMFSGVWGGSMCLTEPHAGSDVGSATSSAQANPDGTYRIKGTKIFISGGDHDLAENIIHLVLARIDGAPAGTKGLSLFIVPRNRIGADGSSGESNAVTVAGLEHKMGLNGSGTVALNFGDGGECIGELVGTVPHQGIKQMFKMMNFARLGVAIQGLGLMAAAYQSALDYAKDRKQGPSVHDWKDPEAPRVSIIQHPNIRRDLLWMKAIVEGTRALVYKIAYHEDRVAQNAGRDDELAAYHQGQVDLLTPLAKAYASERAFEVCAKAIQVFGGAGYLKDWPVEQYCRDAKVFSIYEGTTAIQALDLVGRKLGQAGGQNTQRYLADIAGFVQANKEHKTLGASVGNLEKAHEAVAGGAMQFLAWFQAGELELVPLNAELFLEMMSELTLGWLLLEGAAVAHGKLDGLAEDSADRAFYEGKVQAAIHFATTVLPLTAAKVKVLGAADRSPMTVRDESL
ncbi:MAG: acyl-CoA dehydrogenase [Myxococcales bacterium]|nr:acyl-CoA dehydrogenase [Myxococcales bacterium]